MNASREAVTELWLGSAGRTEVVVVRARCVRGEVGFGLALQCCI